MENKFSAGPGQPTQAPPGGAPALTALSDLTALSSLTDLIDQPATSPP